MTWVQYIPHSLAQNVTFHQGKTASNGSPAENAKFIQHRIQEILTLLPHRLKNVCNSLKTRQHPEDRWGKGTHIAHDPAMQLSSPFSHSPPTGPYFSYSTACAWWLADVSNYLPISVIPPIISCRALTNGAIRNAQIRPTTSKNWQPSRTEVPSQQ